MPGMNVVLSDLLSMRELVWAAVSCDIYSLLFLRWPLSRACFLWYVLEPIRDWNYSI